MIRYETVICSLVFYLNDGFKACSHSTTATAVSISITMLYGLKCKKSAW